LTTKKNFALNVELKENRIYRLTDRKLKEGVSL